CPHAATIEMSPCDEVTTIEMSPNLEVSTGGQIGKDRNEQQGIRTSRSLGASDAVVGEEVFGGGRRAVRADVSGGTLGERRSGGSECADLAALDVGRRVVESGAEAALASKATGTKRACGGTGADGWKFP